MLPDARGAAHKPSDQLLEAICQFVSEEVGVALDRLAPSTALGDDLGVDGQDGIELMEQYGRRFQVDLSAFNSATCFGPEVALNPLMLLRLLKVSAKPRLQPLTIQQLVSAAEIGRWPSDR